MPEAKIDAMAGSRSSRAVIDLGISAAISSA